MNYKISTYFLLAVLTGVIVYSCGSKEGAPDLQANTTDTTSTEEDNAQDCPCRTVLTKETKELLAQPITRTTGNNVPSWQARTALARHRAHHQIDCDNTDPEYIYGFSFGVESFLNFADDVRSLDEAGTGKKLLGVRVYLSRNMRGSQEIPDAFLVPIGLDGYSIYDLDECKINKQDTTKIRNGGTILNTSAPCPNQCQ
jgi:hypothetical protein